MRYPPECYRIEEMVAEHLKSLRPSQQKGLALWVVGTILAKSACQNAVISALVAVGRWHAVRQRLREWLYDGRSKAAPCQTSVDVSLCFAPLLRWVLSLWQADRIALAVDATLCQDRLCALVISVLYKGSAIPVAWRIMPANQKGEWAGPLLELLGSLKGAVPEDVQALVLTDRGLWSPRLWSKIKHAGWRPLMRVKQNTVFQPEGGVRLPARMLLPGPGHAFAGKGAAFGHNKRSATLLAVWAEGQAEPWLVLTDLEPKDAGVAWYGMRAWIEVGFRAIKSVGWQWERTRRSDPERVARHWLVLAVGMLLVLAYGTRAEDAERAGKPPGRLLVPRPCRPVRSRRRVASLFKLGIGWAHCQFGSGRVWKRIWLTPEPWPDPPPGVQVFYHQPQPQTTHTP